MRKIVIIFIITSISYAIGLKALVIPYKASVISLSGAGIADNIDIDINPASISKLKPHVSFSNNTWFSDLKGFKVSYMWDKNHLMSLESLGIDDIELRDEIPNDEPIGYTHAKWLAYDFAGHINFDVIRDKKINLGYKVKFNYSKLHNERYYGYTFDLGMNYQISEVFSFGIVAKNIGREFDDGSYSIIDPMYGVGLSTLIPLGRGGYKDKDVVEKYKLHMKVYSDIVYHDDKLIYKIASKTQFPYINFMLGTSYSDGYRDFSYGMSFDYKNWSFVYGSLQHENDALGSPQSFEIRKYF